MPPWPPSSGASSSSPLSELDLAGGRLRWQTAGHPAPPLLRGGRVVKSLEAEPGLPLGLGDPTRLVTEESLEPGDRLLLFTDGVVEALSVAGDFFGTPGSLTSSFARTLPGSPHRRRCVG